MSSNNNNESSALAMAAAFVGMAALALAIFIAAILVFAAFVLTILSVFAWNKPLQIGKIIIMPDEARGFVRRGIGGAFLIPSFLAFISLFFDLSIEWEYLPHFMLTGYVGGSIGPEILIAQDESQSAGRVYTPAPPAIPVPPPQRLLAPTDSAPFRYASWDDEEARGR